MDQLVQMMGRLDRPGQKSEQLCRAILYMKRTHEEAEVAHLQKHAAFWSLHIKPLARFIVMATDSLDVQKRYLQLLETSKQATRTAPVTEAAPRREVAAKEKDFKRILRERIL